MRNTRLAVGLITSAMVLTACFGAEPSTAPPGELSQAPGAKASLLVTPTCHAPGENTLYTFTGRGFPPNYFYVFIEARYPRGERIGFRAGVPTDADGNFSSVANIDQGYAVSDFRLYAYADENGNVFPDAKEGDSFLINVPCKK